MNYNTRHITTPQGVAAAIAVVDNPKAFSQGISMTTATSGSNGIQVADNNNIDFGTGNFTLVWRGSLPDWTPSAWQGLIVKRSGTTGVNLNGFALAIYTDKLQLQLHSKGEGGDEKALYSSIALTLTDGTEHEIVAVVTRETASAAGSVVFYIDGLQFGTAASIMQGTPYSINTNTILEWLGCGSDGKRFAGTMTGGATFNRALTAAEVLSLYRNGINYADKWGSQTEVMPNTVDRDFSGASAWANVDLNAYDETTDLTITASAANQYCTLVAASAPMTYGKKYRLTFDVANLVSTWTIKDFGGNITIGTVSANGAQSMEFTVTSSSVTGGLRLIAVANDSSGDFDNFSLKQIGATIALESEGIQPSPGQWLDSSSNKLHALQPATGSSLTRRKKDFEIRWTTTWAGTHEAQYIGGINQNILPSNCYIESIIGNISGTVITNLVIGDGSDADKFVELTSGLMAGVVSFPIANRVSGGTNCKLVVDPDANFTGSISWTIKGIILE